MITQRVGMLLQTGTSRALAQACTEVDHTSRREVVSMAQYPDVALDDPGARCCLG